MKTRAYRSFLPTPRNQERLAFAEKLDLNISELINEVLDKHLTAHLQSRAKDLREALNVPVP